MPKRSSFYVLPAEVQREIKMRLAANGFRGYEALADELRGRGYKIGKSSLHRYGVSLERFKQAVRAEAELLNSFDETTRYLITWSRNYPKDANRLVVKLRRKILDFVKDQQ